jgi:hypothetical protein
MRKRVVIAVVLLVIGGGIALLLLLQPPESPVEYHVREYQQAQRKIYGKRTFYETIRDETRMYFGHDTDAGSLAMRMERHEKALLDMGYLEKREFRLTNAPVLTLAVRDLSDLARKELPLDRLWTIGKAPQGTNVLMIRAERHDMRKWEEMVRKVDAGN